MFLHTDVENRTFYFFYYSNLSLVDQYTSLKPILMVAPSVSVPSDGITPSSLVSCPEIIISVLMFHPIRVTSVIE